MPRCGSSNLTRRYDAPSERAVSATPATTKVITDWNGLTMRGDGPAGRFSTNAGMSSRGAERACHVVPTAQGADGRCAAHPPAGRSDQRSSTTTRGFITPLSNSTRASTIGSSTRLCVCMPSKMRAFGDTRAAYFAAAKIREPSSREPGNRRSGASGTASAMNLARLTEATGDREAPRKVAPACGRSSRGLE